MRYLTLALVLLLPACTPGHPPPRRAAADNAARAVPTPGPPTSPITAPAQPAPTAVPTPNPAAVGLSPAQRRAYDLGYRDCSQGRYVPAEHLEAYRIGCAAAHDH